MAYDRDRWEPDGDFEDEPVYSEDDDGSARSLRRYLDFAAVPEPTSLWGSLVKSGYQIVYGLEIEGIPYLFGERELWTTRGVVAASRNADDFTMSYALVLDEGTAFSVECDRENGVASGRAVEFVFGRQQLADEGLGAAIFARPTLRANLTSTINDPADDTFDVDSTSGWDATGLLYVGRECVRYTSTASTQFGGCIRGVAGYPHYHTANTTGGYRQCTDTPVFWRGRLVTVWGHLCGPDGRFLGERWCDHGEWCRQEWRGYVRDAPRPAAGGMVITALPLVRLAAQEFGASVGGTIRSDYIVSGPADQIGINIPGLAELVGPDDPDRGIIGITSWARFAEAGLTGTYGITDLHWTVEVFEGGLRVRCAADLDGRPLRTSAWFLERGEYLGAAFTTAEFTQWAVPFSFLTGSGPDSGGWLVIEQDPEVDAGEPDVPAAGLLAIEDDSGVVEIAAFDETRTAETSTTTGGGVASGPKILRAFRLSARNMLGTDSLARGFNPWRDGRSVRVVSGAVGLWEDCLRTLMTSSGTGARGEFDILPNGFGVSLPDDWIGIGSTYAGLVPTIPSEEIKAVATGKTSVEDMLCGWLALMRSCLVQRRSDDGAVVLEAVSTDVVDDCNAAALADTDVLMDGHESPNVLDAPNHVYIKAGDLLTERPTFVVRDAVRAQAEGVRRVEIKAPGMTDDQALRYGGEMLLLGDGQSAVKMRVPPWVEVQIGDPLQVTTAHPALWDWSTGTHAPASVMARVVGWSREAWSQAQDLTIILAGQSIERRYLCPSARVTQVVSTTVFRVEKRGATGFTAGDAVLLYRRGDEDGTIYQRTLDAIDTSSDNYDLFTISSAAANVSAPEWVVTFDEYANGTACQQRHMFVRSDRYWS